MECLRHNRIIIKEHRSEEICAFCMEEARQIALGKLISNHASEYERLVQEQKEFFITSYWKL